MSPDPPGNGTIELDRDKVVKGGGLSLTCDVPDLGRPAATSFTWRRGGHVVNHVTSATWTISTVTLEMEANISCYAENVVGRGNEDSVTIEVFGECSLTVSRIFSQFHLH